MFRQDLLIELIKRKVGCPCKIHETHIEKIVTLIDAKEFVAAFCPFKADLSVNTAV